MILQVCVIRDIKANVYWNPVYARSIGEAERSFVDEINRASEDNLMYKHPEDFELIHLGTFDSLEAVFELFERPHQLMLGSSAVKKVN